MGYHFSSQIGRNLKGFEGMENAHKMGVSWGKIFAIMGGFLLIFLGAIFLAMRGTGGITSSFDAQAQKATQSAEEMQRVIQADNERQIQEKLRESGAQ